MHAASITLLAWAMIGAACCFSSAAVFPVGAVLALLVALIGLPHGAGDHRLARSRFEPFLGPGWWGVFLVGYLAIAAAVVLGWVVTPAATIILFFFASAWHFGQEEPDLLPCPRDAAPGTRAVLCLRPEKLRFQPWASAGVPALLERTVYLGGQTEYHFTLAGLPVLALRETPPEGDRLRGLKPGDQVTLDWLGEDARLLPEAAR